MHKARYKSKSKSKSKSKAVKLESKAKIRRRLYRLWSQKVLTAHNARCAVTGIQKGVLVDGKPVILDTHHLENRITCPALRFDMLNGIALNKRSHKFGRNSAHKGPIWFGEWLRSHRPQQYAYVLAHRDDPIDLEDRATLAAIEARLTAPLTAEEREILGIAESTTNDNTDTHDRN